MEHHGQADREVLPNACQRSRSPQKTGDWKRVAGFHHYTALLSAPFCCVKAVKDLSEDSSRF